MRWWAGQGRSAEAELEARPKGRRASRGRDWRAEPAGTCRERAAKAAGAQEKWTFTYLGARPFSTF